MERDSPYGIYTKSCTSNYYSDIMSYIKWTATLNQVIISKSNEMSDEDLATYLTKTLNQLVRRDMVRKQRQKLGLHKTGGRGIVKLTKRH